MTTMATQTTEQKYLDAIQRAKKIAEMHDCEVYVAAVLGFDKLVPSIRGFIVVDFYDPTCMCRVSKTSTISI